MTSFDHTAFNHKKYTPLNQSLSKTALGLDTNDITKARYLV